MVSVLFDTKKSSVERGKVWEAVADKLCDIKEPTFKVDQRAVRDHYKKLITRFKRKQKEEDLASGISPEEQRRLLSDWWTLLRVFFDEIYFRFGKP